MQFKEIKKEKMEAKLKKLCGQINGFYLVRGRSPKKDQNADIVIYNAKIYLKSQFKEQDMSNSEEKSSKRKSLSRSTSFGDKINLQDTIELCQNGTWTPYTVK